jgi:hypothetical protein
MKGTSSMSGGDQDQPPMMSPHQDSVANDPVEGPYAIGSYNYEGGAGEPLKGDVPTAPNNGVYYYAKIKTSASGTCTVGFLTGANTDARTYTIHVENKLGDQYKSDEVVVKVETGVPVPPASVTNLHNTTYQQTSITWAWTDSSSADFDHVQVYLNGVFKTNITKGIQTYTATGLPPSTVYTIGTRTVGATGLINSTWVNSTATTAPQSPVPVPPARNSVTRFTGDTWFGPAPLTIQFTILASNDSDTYLWNFGDGTTSTEKNPTHTYNLPGYYRVSLTTFNEQRSSLTRGSVFVVRSKIF